MAMTSAAAKLAASSSAPASRRPGLATPPGTSLAMSHTRSNTSFTDSSSMRWCRPLAEFPEWPTAIADAASRQSMPCGSPTHSTADPRPPPMFPGNRNSRPSPARGPTATQIR